MNYFIGKADFEEDDAQYYPVFQPLSKYSKLIANTEYVSSWKSKAVTARKNYFQDIFLSFEIQDHIQIEYI